MTKLTVEMAHELAERIEESGEHEASVREEYAGRGMFGRTVVGLVTDADGVTIGLSIAQLIEEGGPHWGDLEIDDVLCSNMLRRTDSMGLSTIYY